MRLNRESEDVYKDLGEMLSGMTHEEAREAIIKSIQEDLITQSLLGSGLTSEKADLLRNSPIEYMNEQIREVCDPEREHWQWIVGDDACAYDILDHWPLRLSCDVKIDRIAPPEALQCHGEAAVASYRASMSEMGLTWLARGSLWRVSLVPVVVRGLVTSCAPSLFAGRVDAGVEEHMLYEVLSEPFTGACIDLDLAAYLAVMNYKRAMEAMRSEDGLLLLSTDDAGATVKEGALRVKMFPPDGDGLPVMSLALISPER